MSRVEREIRAKSASYGVDYDAHDSVRSLCEAIAARETLQSGYRIALRVVVRGKGRGGR